jgi:hypothetical protein
MADPAADGDEHDAGGGSGDGVAPDPDLVPEPPREAGVPEPVEERIEDIEPQRLVENEVRARLEADGFTDDEILRWVEAYFAEFHEGEPDEIVAWIRAKEREAGDVQ